MLKVNSNSLIQWILFGCHLFALLLMLLFPSHINLRFLAVLPWTSIWMSISGDKYVLLGLIIAVFVHLPCRCLWLHQRLLWEIWNMLQWNQWNKDSSNMSVRSFFLWFGLIRYFFCKGFLQGAISWGRFALILHNLRIVSQIYELFQFLSRAYR